MASITLQESRGVGDILDMSNYRFEIGQMPGGGNDSQLSIQCTQAIYPGVQNETYPVVFPGGHELTFRGRKVFPKTLSITYVETVRMNVNTVFGRWLEFICGTDSGTSRGYKYSGDQQGGGYTVDGAKLTIFDIVGNVSDVVTWYGLQPTDKPDVNMDSSSTGAWTVSVTMAYDFYYSTLYGPSANIGSFTG